MKDVHSLLVELAVDRGPSVGFVFTQTFVVHVVMIIWKYDQEALQRIYQAARVQVVEESLHVMLVAVEIAADFLLVL